MKSKSIKENTDALLSSKSSQAEMKNSSKHSEAKDNKKEKEPDSNGNSIIIIFKKDAYTAGETVSGNVFLDISTRVKNASITVKISGEQTLLSVDNPDGDGPDDVNYGPSDLDSYKDKQNKVQIKLRGREEQTSTADLNQVSYPQYNTRETLVSYQGAISEPGTLEKGQYDYPFSFLLPDGLPGSFTHVDKNFFAEVSYIVEAWVSEEVKTASLLIVRQPNLLPKLPKTFSESRSFKKWLCFPRGAASVEGSVSSHEIQSDAKLEFKIKVDATKSKLTGSPLLVLLVKSLILNPGQKNGKPSKTENIVVGRLNCDDVLLAGGIFKLSPAIQLKTEIPRGSAYAKNSRLAQFGDAEKYLPLLANSVKSDMFSCCFHAYVWANFSVWDEEAICLDIPFAVLPSEKAGKSRYSFPQKWKPRVYKETVLALKRDKIPQIIDVGYENLGKNDEIRQNKLEKLKEDMSMHSSNLEDDEEETRERNNNKHNRNEANSSQRGLNLGSSSLGINSTSQPFVENKEKLLEKNSGKVNAKTAGKIKKPKDDEFRSKKTIEHDFEMDDESDM